MTGAPAFELVSHGLGRARNGTPLTACPLDPAQAEALGAIFAAMDPWASYPYRAAGIARYLAGGTADAPVFAIMTDGHVAGVIGLRADWLLGPYIQFLAVKTEYHGEGIGGRAMEWVEGEARRVSARNLWVAASDFNAGALRFYQRHGFCRVADLPTLVRDDRTEVLLRKRLGL